MINLSTTIFNKPLDKVIFTDVEAFCNQQIEEGINLDYKRDLNPKSLVKTIASFANTRGGWIIVGVEDKDAKPIVPAKGIPFVREMPLTITNIVLSNISPPIIPICHVCPKNKDGNTFMIIYVPESPESPHWIFNKSQLYVRVAQRTDSGDWERLASSDEWEWLRNKREKSEKLRNDIKREVDSLFREYYWEETKRQTNQLVIPIGGRRDDKTRNMLNMYISPLYPSKALFNVDETYDTLERSSVPDYYRTDYKFPTGLNDRNVFTAGTNTFGMFDDSNCHFSALHVDGLFSTKETIITNEEYFGETIPLVEFSRIAARLDQFLEVANSIYKSTGFEGLLYWEIFIDGVSWMQIKFPVMNRAHWTYKCPTGEFFWFDNFTTSDLSEEEYRYRLIHGVLKGLMYAFRYKDFSSKILEDYYKTNSRFCTVIK